MRIGPAKRVIEVDPVEEPVPGLVPAEPDLEPLPAPETIPEPAAPEPAAPEPAAPEPAAPDAPEPEKEPAGSLARSVTGP
jgi:hypothetical protein